MPSSMRLTRRARADQAYIRRAARGAVELTRDEERALAGEDGEAMQTAYRVLLATGEAAGAGRLVPVRWAHLSGVNYNTIGEAGREFLGEMAGAGARVAVRATLNPMGYDADSVSRYGLSDDFLAGQESIRRSYHAMGVEPSYSCVPYEIYRGPGDGAQVAFAESNAAIYANSLAGMKTNKESAFSALASALTGKSPASDLRGDEPAAPAATVRMGIEEPTEMDYGLLGFFAGRHAGGESVGISGVRGRPDMRSCKSLCGGMGTSGACARFVLEGEEGGGGGGGGERIDFGRKEAEDVRGELDTAESGDVVVLGSPQLGLGELGDLAGMLRGRRFRKRCLVFCPRAAQADAERLGYTAEIGRAGGEMLYDCCACLTPLICGGGGDGSKGGLEVDAVVTNSIKGAYYLNNATGVGVNLKPLAEIIRDESE